VSVRTQTNRISTHRPCDVLDLLVAHILEAVIDLIAHIVARLPRQADAAGIGQRLDPRRHIDAVAEQVAILQHDVADIDSDAEFHAL